MHTPWAWDRLGLTPAHHCDCSLTPGLRPSRPGLTPAHDCGCFFDSGPPAQLTRTHAGPRRLLFFDSGPPAQPTRDLRRPMTAAVSLTPGLRPSRPGLTPAHDCCCFLRLRASCPAVPVSAGPRLWLFFDSGPPAQPTRTCAGPRLRLFFDSGPPAQLTRTHAGPQLRLFLRLRASGPADPDLRRPTAAAVSLTSGLRPSRPGLTPAHDCGCFFDSGPPAQPTRSYASPRLWLPLFRLRASGPADLDSTGPRLRPFFDSGPPA